MVETLSTQFGYLSCDGVVPVVRSAIAQSVAGPMYLATNWGGSLMFTTGITWLTLIAGITLAVMALGAQSAQALRRLRDAAVILTAASAAIALVIWGTPEGSTLAPNRDLGMMCLASAVLGILVLFLVAARRRHSVNLLGETSETPAQLLESVIDTIAHESTLNRMLMGVASSLRTATGATAALVYKLGSLEGTPQFVGSAVPPGSPNTCEPPSEFATSLASRYAIADCVCEFQPDRESSHSGNDAEWGIVPLTSGGTVLATILLKEPKVRVTSAPANGTIRTVASLAGRALSDWVDAVRGVVSDRLAQNLYSLSSALLDEKSLERGLPVIARALSGLMPVDYLSVSWLNRAHFHEDRTSMIIGQRRVVENRRKWPIWDGTTHRLLGMARPLITPDLLQSPEESPATGSWESRLGLRSRIVVPIRDGERLLGSLTLAHREVARYGLDETGPLVAIASCVGLWLKQLEAVRIGHRYSEVTLLANQWDHDLLTSKTDEDLLKEAHRTIRTSALRLYRLTADGMAMEIAASTGRGGEGPHESTRIPLTSTPWHRWSLDDSMPRRIDQSDPETLMEKTEAELSMLPRMKTGWIVPIICAGRTAGFVDAVETRDPDRHSLDEPERLLLGSLARAYARRWSKTAEPEQAPQVWQGQDRLAEFNHSIVNPLTGIIGSVELIRHKQALLSDESVKYLNIIERSANRIHTAALQSLTGNRGAGNDPDPDRETASRLESFAGVTSDVTVNRQDSSLSHLRSWRVEPPVGEITPEPMIDAIAER